MFRPARMARVVLGGHKEHMRGVIETLHREALLHLEDYADPTGSTAIGTPLEEGDQISELLLRTRGLLKSLGIEEGTAKQMAPSDPASMVDEAEARILPVLEDLSAARAEAAKHEADAAALADLEILDVDLSLTSLTSVRGFVGSARGDVAAALDAAGIAHETASGEDAVATFVAAKDGARAEAVLAQLGFVAATLPAGTTRPRERLAEARRGLVAAQERVTKAEAELATLATEWGSRLGALEHHLAFEADRTQAPLHFRETATTFHAEGWVPRGKANRIQNVIQARFGESVYVEVHGDRPEIHAAHAAHGAHASHAQTGAHAEGVPTHGPGAMHAGGHDAHGAGTHDAHGDHDDPAHHPPVHLENVKPARPYEFLLSLMGRPLYREVDPTILMFIFFPLFFGFMVGDVIVGLAIAGVGLLVKKHKIFGIGGPAVSRILVLSGLIAVLFGFVVFGEGLGIHFVVDDAAAEEGELSWEVLLYGKENVLAGHGFPHEGFIHKTSHAAAHGEPAPDNGTMTILAEATEEHSSPFTIAPHGTTHLSFNGWFNLGYYSKIHDVVALLIWSLVIGVLHLVLGLFIGVRNIAVGHGIKLAVQERVSWLLLLASVGFIVWGLTGSTGWALPAGVGLAVASVVLLIMGMTHQLGNPFVATMVVILEVPSIFGNILSYARLAAIGASKAGMAIAFSAIGFLLSGGEVGIVWWIIYIFGMIVITGLAILSGGLQSLRLQFVEFFSKFYEGGGRPYVPFGRRAP